NIKALKGLKLSSTDAQNIFDKINSLNYDKKTVADYFLNSFDFIWNYNLCHEYFGLKNDPLEIKEHLRNCSEVNGILAVIIILIIIVVACVVFAICKCSVRCISKRQNLKKKHTNS
ncbi:MAG: hypothetical protein MHPSP_004386, partial [Paramarteilia canceri]